ncbi:hypothetical protein BD413DRAFT_494484 [Trametes elegans]|nr:hypothetical protein BD413DRAFT_494484 [Trametes elegans]
MVKKVLMHVRENVVIQRVRSSSVQMLETDASAETSLDIAGVGLKFFCRREQGAFLFVNPPADSKRMHARTGIVHYIHTNIDSWHTWMSDDILFISVTTVTEDWSLGAFLGGGSGGEINFESSFGPFAQGNFSVKYQRAMQGHEEYRVKPSPRAVSLTLSTDTAATDLSVSVASSLHRAQSGGTKDQCLVVKAVAGPEDPEKNPRLVLTKATSLLVMGMTNLEKRSRQLKRLWGRGVGLTFVKSYDPVNYLLDYILDYVFEDGTQADNAIASTSHLYVLFTEGFPHDIPATLKAL